jgi:dGTPase
VVHECYPELEDRRLIYEIIRRMIGAVVSDLIEESRRRIDAAAPASIEDVRNAAQPLISMSDSMYEQHMSLKRFLRTHLYSHEQKLEMTRTVQAMINELFTAYMADETKMPAQFARAARNAEGIGRARVVADFIAGMTDRYAIAAHEVLTA